MQCKLSNEQYRTATWRFFYPTCKKNNLRCNAASGAYVPAITVCTDSLWLNSQLDDELFVAVAARGGLTTRGAATATST